MKDLQRYFIADKREARCKMSTDVGIQLDWRVASPIRNSLIGLEVKIENQLFVQLLRKLREP